MLEQLWQTWHMSLRWQKRQLQQFVAAAVADELQSCSAELADRQCSWCLGNDRDNAVTVKMIPEHHADDERSPLAELQHQWSWCLGNDRVAAVKAEMIPEHHADDASTSQ